MWAVPTLPRVARAFCRLVLIQWGLVRLTGDCELIVSELATNVVEAATAPDGQPRYDPLTGRAPVTWLNLLSDGACLRVEVWDGLPVECGVPIPCQAAEDDEFGRGLTLVEALSTDWGWEHLPGGTKKRVWAILG
jgi:hypothetical protein